MTQQIEKYLKAFMPEQKPRTSLPFILHQADMMAAGIEFEIEWLPKFSKNSVDTPKKNYTLNSNIKSSKTKALNSVIKSRFKKYVRQFIMVEIILVLLSLLVVIFGYTTFNLLRKNEKAEDILVSHQEFINKVEEHIIFSNDRLKEIDKRGTFKSDDEIGWFFE